MKLRVVNVDEWINGTNDNPQGEYLLDCPDGWDDLDEAGRAEWTWSAITGLGFLSGTRVTYEYGELTDGVWVADAGSQPVAALAIAAPERAGPVG